MARHHRHILQMALAAFLAKIGIRPSGKLVTKQIQEIPDFFDPLTGAFDKDAYNGFLGRNGMTAPEFERAVRADAGSLA